MTGGTLGNSFADAERGSDERGVLHGAPAGNNAIGAATAGGIRDRYHGLGASEQNHESAFKSMEQDRAEALFVSNEAEHLAYRSDLSTDEI